MVELAQPGDGTDDVSGLVHNDDGGSAETGLDVLEGVKVHQDIVAGLAGQDRSRGSTWNDGFEVVPAAANTAAVFIDEFAKRNGHFLLDCAGVVDVAGNAEELCAGVALPAEGVEPVCAATEDGGGNGDGLDVGDCGGAAEETDGGGEGGLETRLAGLALEGFDQGCFLTTDVRTHAAVNEDVEVEASPAGVLADEAGLVGFLDGSLEDGGFVVEFTADVNVGGCTIHSTTGHETSFNELVRVFAHDLTVLACSWFTFIGVYDEVAGLCVFVPVFGVHE